MGAAMFVSGPLYETLGAAAYTWMAGMAALATAGAVMLWRRTQA
jgi:hypothetical protein